MENDAVSKFINNIIHFNSIQYRQLKSQIKKIDSERFVALNLETKITDLKCPHCSSVKIHRWGKRNGLQRYRCIKCVKTFNSLTGTPLSRLRMKEKWLIYSQCLIDGLTVRKAANICGVHWNTCFKWRHRFLNNTNEIKAKLLTGIVEAEETYVLKSYKGQNNLPRIARKRAITVNNTHLKQDKVCVFISRDRKGYVYDKIYEKFNSEGLMKTFGTRILKDILLCSDNKSVYKRFTKQSDIVHGFLNITSGQRVKKNIVHIQNVNSYHRSFKIWLERFKGVATSYLENYLSWYRFMDEFNHNINPQTILLRSKSGGKYKSQPIFVT